MKEKLKRIASLSGKTIQEFEENKKYYSTGNINTDNYEVITYKNRPSRANIQVTEKDILIAKMKNTNKTTIATKEMENNVYSTGFTILNTNTLYYKYLYYLLCSPEFIEKKDVFSVGTTQIAINDEALMNIELEYIQDYELQKKIADYLDKKIFEIDNTIEKTKETIEDYKNYKQSLITEIVTKGLNNQTEMKDSEIDWIGQIPTNWKIKKIKYVCDISRGLFNHRPRNDERFYDGEYPFIQTGDVTNSNKYITNYSQTLNELGKNVSKEFPKGTLTMTIAANVGDVAILGFDSYFPDSIIGFVPKKNISNLYLYYIFKAMKQQFINASIVSTQLNLNMDRVSELKIPITYDSTEQELIVKYLEEKCEVIDKLINEKNIIIEELEQYKKSLIYEYVTGKKEVV